MTFPIQEEYRLTTEFWQGRPLLVEQRQKTHVHGAWDAACPVGTKIHAPEAGQVFYMLAYRADISRGLFEVNIEPQPFNLRGHHYFYDTYGGLIILMGESGTTHVMAHSFGNQLYNAGYVNLWKYQESPKQERWPVCAFHTFASPVYVEEGAIIGAVGNAGLSTGAHLHYEMHDGRRYKSYRDRIDPAKIYPGEWLKHRSDERGYDWREERDLWA